MKPAVQPSSNSPDPSLSSSPAVRDTRNSPPEKKKLEEIKDFEQLCRFISSFPEGEERCRAFIEAAEDLLIQLNLLRPLINTDERLLTFLNLFTEQDRFTCLEIIKTCVLELINTEVPGQGKPEKIARIMKIINLLPLSAQIEFGCWFKTELPDIYREMVKRSPESLLLLLKAHSSKAQKQYCLTALGQDVLLTLLASKNVSDLADILAALPFDNTLYESGLNFTAAMQYLTEFAVIKKICFAELLTMVTKLPLEYRELFIRAFDHSGKPITQIIMQTEWLPNSSVDSVESKQPKSSVVSVVSSPSRAPALSIVDDSKLLLSSSSRDVMDLNRIQGDDVPAFRGIISTAERLLVLLEKLAGTQRNLSALQFQLVTERFVAQHLRSIVGDATVLQKILSLVAEQHRLACVELLGKEHVLLIYRSAVPSFTFLRLLPAAFIVFALPNMQEVAKQFIKMASINEVEQIVDLLAERKSVWQEIVFKGKSEASIRGALQGAASCKTTHPLHYQLLLSAVALAFVEKSAFELNRPKASPGASPSGDSILVKNKALPAAQALATLLRFNVRVQEEFKTGGNIALPKEIFDLNLWLPFTSIQMLRPIFDSAAEVLVSPAKQQLSVPVLNKQLAAYTGPEHQRNLLPLIWLLILESVRNLVAYDVQNGSKGLRVGRLLFDFMQDAKQTPDKLTAQLKQDGLEDMVKSGLLGNKDSLVVVYEKCISLKK